MKERLVNVATAIQNSRTAKVLAFVAVIWVSILLGFVGSSWVAGKTQKGVTLKPQPFAVQPKRHSRASGKTAPRNLSASNSAVPCTALSIPSQGQPSTSVVPPIAAQDQAGNDQTRNTPPP